jgi:hypothetical protein
MNSDSYQSAISSYAARVITSFSQRPGRPVQCLRVALNDPAGPAIIARWT